MPELRPLRELIQRAARRAAVLRVLVAAALLGVVSCNLGDARLSLAGPRAVSVAELAALDGRQYVTVTGSRLLDTGLAQLTTVRRGGSLISSTTETYSLLVGADVGQLLVVRAPGATGATGTTLTGLTERLGSDERNRLAEILRRAGSGALSEALLPQQLVVRRLGPAAVWWAAVPFAAALAALVWLGRALWSGAVPTAHPAFRAALASDGAARLDADLRNPERRLDLPGLVFTQEALIETGDALFPVRLIPTADLVWAYSQQTTHTRAGRVTGTTNTLMLALRDGRLAAFPQKTEQQVEAGLQWVQRHVPGVLLGFSAERARAFREQRGALVRTLDEWRAAHRGD